MGLDYSDARPSYVNLFTGTLNSAKNVPEHWAGIQLGLQADAGSSSRSGRDREQQLKRTQAARMQLKRAQSGSSSSELSGAGVIKFWGPRENGDTGSLFFWDYGDPGSPFWVVPIFS